MQQPQQGDVFGSERICITLANGLQCHGALSEYVLSPTRFELLRCMSAPALAPPLAGVREREGERAEPNYGSLHGPCIAPPRISAPYKALSTQARTVIVGLLLSKRQQEHPVALAYWQWYHDAGAGGMQMYWRCVATVYRYLACSGIRNYCLGPPKMQLAEMQHLFNPATDATLASQTRHAGAACMLRLTLLCKQSGRITHSSADDMFTESAVAHLSLDAHNTYHQKALVLYTTGKAFGKWFADTYGGGGQVRGMVVRTTKGLSKPTARNIRTAAQLFAAYCASTGDTDAQNVLFDRSTLRRAIAPQVLHYFMYRALGSWQYTAVMLLTNQ